MSDGELCLDGGRKGGRDFATSHAGLTGLSTRKGYDGQTLAVASILPLLRVAMRRA